MAITMTLRAVLEAQPALDRLAGEKLPVRLAYHVAKLVKLVRVEVEDFNAQRFKLVKEYGVTRPATEAERPVHGPEVIEVPPEKIAAFQQELATLVDEPVTFDRAPLSITDTFPNITAADLVALGPLVDEGDA
jgi:hypothetical protein